MQALLLSPQAFLSLRAVFSLSPRAPFFVAPSEARGPSALSCLGKTQWGMSPRAPLFVTPKRKREVPRHWRASGRHSGECHPEPPFCHPEAQARGPSALMRLGKTSKSAVPNEVKDASLSLGRTKWSVVASLSLGTTE